MNMLLLRPFRIPARPSLSATLRLQLRLTARPIPTRSSSSGGPASSSSAASPPAVSSSSRSLVTDPLEPRLSLTFTCTVPECSTRSSHTFTRRAYERGIVIVQCPGCKNRHLIADHLGWFKESTEEGKLKTIEDLLRARGEHVRRGRLDAGGVVEYTDDQ